MKTLVAALALMSLSSAAALACTQDEMTKKAQDYSTKFQALAQKDPKKATEVSQQIQKEAQEKSAKIKSIDDSCAYYDDLIKLVSQ
jgi:transketolase